MYAVLSFQAFIYELHIEDSIRRVLDYYQDFVVLHKMPLVPGMSLAEEESETELRRMMDPDDPEANLVHKTERVTMNRSGRMDCLYRYTWITVSRIHTNCPITQHFQWPTHV